MSSVRAAADDVDVHRFGAASYVPALTLEKPLYVRERNDGLYRPITYLLAKIFDEIFVTTISSLVFSAFVFYVVKLQGDFIIFWLTYFVTLSTGIVLAYVVATLAPNMDVANAALPTYVVRPPLLSLFTSLPGRHCFPHLVCFCVTVPSWTQMTTNQAKCWSALCTPQPAVTTAVALERPLACMSIAGGLRVFSPQTAEIL